MYKKRCKCVFLYTIYAANPFPSLDSLALTPYLARAISRAILQTRLPPPRRPSKEGKKKEKWQKQDGSKGSTQHPEWVLFCGRLKLANRSSPPTIPLPKGEPNQRKCSKCMRKNSVSLFALLTFVVASATATFSLSSPFPPHTYVHFATLRCLRCKQTSPATPLVGGSSARSGVANNFHACLRSAKVRHAKKPQPGSAQLAAQMKVAASGCRLPTLTGTQNARKHIHNPPQ